MSEQPKDYNVFLSHSSADKPAVERLAQRLVEAGLTPFLDKWHLIPGEAWQEALEDALDRSATCAVFLGPSGLGPWENEEMRSALDDRVRSKAFRVIPVLLPGANPKDSDTLPRFLRRLTWVDFRNGLEDDEAFRRLVAGIRGVAPGPAPPTSPLDADALPPVAPLPPGSRMPLPHNPRFVGREEELRELARLLDAGRTVAVGQVAAATGLGGIGKSQLAAEYAHRCGTRYVGGVFWLDCGDPVSVPHEVARCGGLEGMNLPHFPDALPDQIERVKAEWRKDTPRLLIFDNVEDPQVIADWTPTTGGCRVLVTSRRADFPATLGVALVRLDTLPRPDSLRLLCGGWEEKRGKSLDDLLNDPHERAAANEICALLGDLPLALHLAGCYLAAYAHDLSLADYQATLRAQPVLQNAALVEWVKDPSPTRHVQNVAATFDLSHRKLNPDDPTDALALRVFHRAGFFAPVSIGRELLMRAAGLDATTDRLRFADAVRCLAALGLMAVEEDGRLRLHRLLGEFARHNPPTGEDAEANAAAVWEAIRAFAYEVNQSGLPASLRAEVEHLRHAAEQADARGSKQAGGLYGNLGYYLWMVADYARARACLERALSIDEAALGSDHPQVAIFVNNLGEVLRALGDYAGARACFERALRIVEQHLGSDHPNVATLVNNLGEVLRALGDYAGARGCFERALRIDEAALGTDHPNVAIRVNNLGGVLWALGDYAGARGCFERALRICERSLGPDHPRTRTARENLAGLGGTE